MNEGEANKLSMCGYGCNIIGGPWISTNPNCPDCNGHDKYTPPRKTLRDAEDIVADLLVLKEELWQAHKGRPIDNEAAIIALKINSCLYSGYPYRKREKNGQD